MATLADVHWPYNKTSIVWILQVIAHMDGAYANQIYKFCARHAPKYSRNTVKAAIFRALEKGLISVDAEQSKQGNVRLAIRYFVVTAEGREYLESRT